MSAPREALLQTVRDWPELAEEDLRMAEHGLTIPPPCPYRLVCYHAQQCAEKYLKAYLVFRGVDFPYTHNISVLVELFEKIAGSHPELADVDSLSAYAISIRYPGIGIEIKLEAAKRAIAQAKLCRERIREVLGLGGMPL